MFKSYLKDGVALLLIVLVLAFSLPTFAIADSKYGRVVPWVEVEDEINAYCGLDSACRGSYGKEAEEACAARDDSELLDRIAEKGWCFGHRNEASYQMKWHACEPTSFGFYRMRSLQGSDTSLAQRDASDELDTAEPDAIDLSTARRAAHACLESIEMRLNAADPYIWFFTSIEPQLLNTIKVSALQGVRFSAWEAETTASLLEEAVTIQVQNQLERRETATVTIVVYEMREAAWKMMKVLTEQACFVASDGSTNSRENRGIVIN